MTKGDFLSNIEFNSFWGWVFTVIVILVSILVIKNINKIKSINFLQVLGVEFFDQDKKNNKSSESLKKLPKLDNSPTNIKTILELSPYINSNLNKISDHQVEKNLTDIPNNYYGYIHPFYDLLLVQTNALLSRITEKTEKKEINFSTHIQDSSNIRVYNEYSEMLFEFFKTNQEYFLCFYLNEQIYYSIENNNGKNRVEITCSSVYRDDFTIPCYIEFSKILYINSRNTPKGIFTDMYIEGNVIKIKVDNNNI
jgi:hypothetical protein